MLLLFFPLWGELRGASICEQSFGSGTSKAYITWETQANGDILISLSGNGVAFRGNNGMDNANLTNFTVDGQPAADMFQRGYTAGGTTFTLQLKADVAAPDSGAVIHYRGTVEYVTSSNNNAYGTYTFDYSYGATCSQLSSPEITAISATGVPTFTPVEGATSYTVYVYLGTILKYSQTITPGQAIAFTPLQTATYNVTMTASAAGQKSSDESEPFPWSLTATPVTLGGSEYCEHSIGSGNQQAALTWITLPNGDVQITIGGSDRTAFRGNNGMSSASLSAFQVGYGAASDYFSRVYSAGSNTFVLHLKDPSVAPAPGEVIHYSGTVEYMTSTNSNAYGNYTFNYTYGTICGALPQPVITSITADSAVVFDALTGATNYEARVYLDGVFKYSQSIQPGGVLHFVPYESGTYLVTITASGAGYTDSPESEPYAWTLTVGEITIGDSEYCNTAFSSGSSLSYLTWQTLPNGDVEIAISGDAGTAFRGNGFGSDALSGFRVGALPASAFFERQYDGDGASVYTLHLRDSLSRPSLGQPISFSGTVEWRTAGNTNAYGTQRFSYTYGAVCPGLQAPSVVSISPKGVLTLADKDPDAAYFRVNIYRGELLVATLQVQDGDTLSFDATASYDYTVYVQACPATAGSVPSAWSEPYIWHVNAEEPDVPMSSLCAAFVSSNDGGVYLTAETDDDGQIRFTISGPSHPVWRAAGINLKAMFIGANSIDDYFVKYGSFVGDSVLVLRPTTAGSGVFFPGDVVSFNGTLEWSIVDATGTAISRWVEGYKFTYIYGSTCTMLLPRLDTPQSLAITDEGELTFLSVENADSYQVRVLDADADEMLRHLLQSGDTVLREQAVFAPFTYFVSVRALPADAALFRPSYWSDLLQWNPSERPILPPDTPIDDPEYNDPEGYDMLTSSQVVKFYRDGQILIVRDGVIYTLLGHKLCTIDR